MLEFRILGPLEVVRDGESVRLGGPKQRATLAILLLHANSVVSVDRLADDLYAGAPPVTAVTQVQRQISELRKALGDPAPIDTRPPGYILRVSHDELDLQEFENLSEAGTRALEAGDAHRASDLLRRALQLRRGEPLADVGYEEFAQRAIDRLAEMQLATLEQRIEADLACGRHGELVPELDDLTATHPLRERLHGQLMLALYRSGRQVDALEVYRRARGRLRDEFGIEPGPALNALERAVLEHNPSLQLERTVPNVAAADSRTVIAVAASDKELEELCAVAAPLAARGSHELILARLVQDEGELSNAASVVNERRASISSAVRAAAFTTAGIVDDALRLASSYDAELVLVPAPPELARGSVPSPVHELLERSAADVAVVARAAASADRGSEVFVPFGGSEHDWAALELAAWLADGLGAPVRLVGTKSDPSSGRRDASRLLADAALAVQRVVGVVTEPLLVDPGAEALTAAVRPAKVVVVGISPRWRRDGIGDVRRALVTSARSPTLLVHHGPRPGGLAPQASRTRFSWTIQR